MVDGAHDVVLTPDFLDDLRNAAEYISLNLGNPRAAQRMVDGLIGAIEAKRAMPTAAPLRIGPAESKRYIASYKRWQAVYVVEGSTIKVLGLRHDRQGYRGGYLPGE